MRTDMYAVDYEKRVIKKDVPALSVPVKHRILKAIEEKLQVDPLHFGEPLKHQFFGLWRLRVGDYRVMYAVDEAQKLVTIVAIGHRSVMYN